MRRLETPAVLPEGAWWGIRGRLGSLPQSAKMTTRANSNTPIVIYGIDFGLLSPTAG
jgi:hypothetical protein